MVLQVSSSEAAALLWQQCPRTLGFYPGAERQQRDEREVWFPSAHSM